MSIGEIVRLDGFDYLVPSDVLGRSPYKVSLTAYHKNGQCVCKDFETRCFPNLRKTGVINDETTRCKHIRRARAACMDEILERFLENEKKQNGQNQEA